jgi:hypothetical protein
VFNSLWVSRTASFETKIMAELRGLQGYLGCSVPRTGLGAKGERDWEHGSMVVSCVALTYPLVRSWRDGCSCGFGRSLQSRLVGQEVIPR